MFPLGVRLLQRMMTTNGRGQTSRFICVFLVRKRPRHIVLNSLCARESFDLAASFDREPCNIALQTRQRWSDILSPRRA